MIIFATLFLPVVYVLAKHGRHGFIGWFYLLAFCVIRMVGGILTLSGGESADTFISQIGLSPLLLSIGGIIHEA